ncbi:MAG TPA: hypothetical protein PKV73_20135, partial [Agriterribacter sp.]|nr:hypothetical protein [Agriterribacter sp.]
RLGIRCAIAQYQPYTPAPAAARQHRTSFLLLFCKSSNALATGRLSHTTNATDLRQYQPGRTGLCYHIVSKM